MNSFVVYFHINPIKQEVFYVGIGYLKRALTIGGRNKFWHRTVKKYGYEVTIIHNDLTWEEACELEIKYIKQIGRRDLDLGTLVNETFGGDGFRGKHSEETKLKMSLAQKIRIHPKGHKMSEETKKKISVANKGKKKVPHSIERRKQIGLSSKGRKHSEFVRKKMSNSKLGNKCGAGNKGRTYTVEEKLQRSITLKKYWMLKKKLSQ